MGVRHIGHCDKYTGLLQIEIDQPPGLNDQLADRPSGAFEVNNECVGRWLPRHRYSHQRSKLRAVPFAGVQGIDRLARKVGSRCVEGVTE
jgi:hypothetical protein